MSSSETNSNSTRDSLARISRPLVGMLTGPPRRSTISSEVREGMNVSMTEGTLANIYSVFSTGSYLTGFALLLGLTERHLGILGALPMLANIPGLAAVWVAARIQSHKRVVLPLAALGAFLWVPMIALPFVPMSQSARIWTFLALFFLSSLLQGSAGIVWQGWISDLVPERLRGRFWGRRNQLVNLGSIAAMIFAGVLLDAFKDGGAELAGYVVLVLIALGFRTGSLAGLRRQYEVPYSAPAEHGIWHNLARPLRDPGFRPLLIALGFFQFSIGIIGAFVGAYMLDHLHLSFTVISALTIMHQVIAVFASNYWGVVMDRSGVRPVIIMTCFLTGIVPMLWILSLRMGMPMIIMVWVVSGIGWVGFNLAAQTMPFALSPRQGRTYYLAVLNIVTGVVFCIGSVLGGEVAERLRDFHGHLGPLKLIHFHLLFFLSGLGRFSCIWLFTRVRETRSRPMLQAVQFESSLLWTQLINVTQIGALAFQRFRRRTSSDPE
ncbi:MFS transporter [Candidatus Poribacteria bacterium]|nr:MFS transporter [Candidatus Poribacteria bacterium]